MADSGRRGPERAVGAAQREGMGGCAAGMGTSLLKDWAACFRLRPVVAGDIGRPE
jgi:hypothetical protein